MSGTKDFNFEKILNAMRSFDRVDTGYKDINGQRINVGDVLEDRFGEQYFVNFDNKQNKFYALGNMDKRLKAEDFSLYMNVGVAIIKEDIV